MGKSLDTVRLSIPNDGVSSHPQLNATEVAKLRARFEDYARKHGLKSTTQRDAIVEQFLRSSGHMSIEDLLARVRKRSPKVGYATVYRTMKLLTDSGLAAARQFGDGQTRYEVMSDEHAHHDHLICVQCGLILEFENDTIEKLQDEMADRLGGFTLEIGRASCRERV